MCNRTNRIGVMQEWIVFFNAQSTMTQGLNVCWGSCHCTTCGMYTVSAWHTAVLCWIKIVQKTTKTCNLLLFPYVLLRKVKQQIQTLCATSQHKYRVMLKHFVSMKTMISLVLIIVNQRDLGHGLKFNVLNHNRAHGNSDTMCTLVVPQALE